VRHLIGRARAVTIISDRPMTEEDSSDDQASRLSRSSFETTIRDGEPRHPTPIEYKT
jgi:hypothetical protein